MSDSAFDIVVVGAGISGLAFVAFYLDIHPKCHLIILEADACIGGVWSSARCYDGFWTQSGRRMIGFSDVPLNLSPEAPTFYGTFQAKYVTDYLENHVNTHIYNGETLRSRIAFETKVESIKKVHDSWVVSARTTDGSERNLRSARVVVASGLTSVPNLPRLPNQSTFRGPVYHHKQFGNFERSFLQTKGCERVAVLGGGKSATDMVYECVKKGKIVSWIIRKEGEGPALFFPAPGSGQFENSTEVGATRWKQSFSPSSFMPNSWLIRAIHGTETGRNYLSRKIREGDQACRDVAAYHHREGALPDFQNLECTTSSFWCTGPLGLVQHDDFWDTLAKNVKVYRQDISSLNHHSILLADGSEVLADALLCGTGWGSQYPFFSEKQNHTLGLPHSPNEDSAEEAEQWRSLLKSADARVISHFPMLEHPPPNKSPEIPTTTARLYNCIVPLEDDSIVFLGRAHLSNSFRAAEAQAIWATAFFDGNIKIPPLEQAKDRVAYMNAFSRRRYPSHGAAGDYLFFELVWYTDRLLEEIGLKSHRKGWWRDFMDPCLASDFKNLKDEYRSRFCT